MKTTEDEILRKAFRLFLEKNYEKVTVTELEKATGISRGGIFHYMGNKKGLFHKVVDKYVFEVLDVNKKLVYPPDIRLENFMDLYTDEIDKNLKLLTAEADQELMSGSNSYFQFLIQANKYYPNFKKQMKMYDAKLYRSWKNIICQAQQSGEIKDEMESHQILDLFRYTYYGLVYGTSFVDNGPDIKKLSSDFHYIYSLIKK